MGIKTDLSQTPYHNDYDETKNYYNIPFKPGVAVQTRELNELQSILQKQIERFGDNIFKSGTIINGVNFIFHNNYPYVKLLDSQVDGTTVLPSEYIGLFVKNSANLVGYVINYDDGFEASGIDLKTLYVNYINSGNTGTLNAFSVGDTLTIYSSNVGIESITVENGGVAFSNSDNLIITPAVAVNVSSGTFSNGDYLIQPSTGANLEIISVDETTLAQSNQVLLYIQPRATDLANALANSTMWTLSVNEPVVDSGNAVAGVIENVFGQNANGTIITNSSGRVTSIVMAVKGDGYDYLPSATIKSANNSSGITNLVLSPKNHVAQVQISPDAGSVGNGYAFSVGEGVIFQKGHFIRVEPQTIIVSKYSNSPNNITVGFDTREEIVTYLQDPELLDNALGTENETAPGADRLKLTPVLITADTEDALSNNEFFGIVEWSEGQPYKQNGQTIYSRLGDEMATRTYEQSGDFIMDRYYVATSVDDDFSLNGQYYKVTVDPGTAYIKGYRVQTTRNYNINVEKGIDTQVSNTNISLNYGNYVRIREVGGLFQYSTGDVVDLYSTAKNFLSNTALVTSSNTTPVGTKIGEARIRSMVLENGVAGDRNATYRLFLFDIKMNPGKKFDNSRAVYYNGTYKGIADIITSLDPSTGATIAKLEGNKNNRLLFPSGAASLKNSNNSYYIYRTIDQTTTTGNNGVCTKSIASNPDELYPYSGTLSDANLKELYVVPLSRDLVAYANLTGSVDVTSGSANLTGTSTTFITDLEAGDWVRVYSNNTAQDIKQIITVANNTHLTLDSALAFTNAASEVYRAFPKNVPVPFGSRSGLSANVDANSNILTLNFGMTFEGTTPANTAVGVNIRRGAVTSTSKTANRNKYVRIKISNNDAGISGPWCLGVPDVFRLRNVYQSETVTVSTLSRNVTDEFYIDHNQNANYLDLSWLYKKERSSTPITANSFLLVEFDYFTRSGAGYFDTVSYLNTSNTEQIQELDGTPLANLTTAAASLEIPEIHTYDGKHYDLIGSIDFRPAVANTISPGTGVVSAPINPAATISFGNTADPANDLKFPFPDSIMTSQIEQYLGRIDHVKISGTKGRIFVSKGIPSADPRKRYEPNPTNDSLVLYKLNVPPYPNYVTNPTLVFEQVANTGVINEVSSERPTTHIIDSLLSNKGSELLQPKTYTMEDIGNLERRLKDVEYYVSLSLLETSVTSKVIPSSIDGSLNRFKFGFAVDDFTEEHYIDYANPQYNATREPHDEANNTWRIAPPLFNWRINNTLIANMPFIDEVLIEQPHATEETNPCVPRSGTFQSNTGESFYFALQTDPYGSEERRDYLVLPGINPLSTQQRPVTIYFYNYSGYDKIDVYQANSTANVLVASTTSDLNMVSNLSTADKAFLSTNTHARAFYTSSSGTLSTVDNVINLDTAFTRGGTNNDYVNRAGKITFNHNAFNGRNYIIKVTKGPGSSLWRYLVKYPSDAEYNATVINPCSAISILPTAFFGTGGVLWACNNRRNREGFLQDFRIQRVAGLKPSTVHTVTVNGRNVGTWRTDVGGRIGTIEIDLYGTALYKEFATVNNGVAKSLGKSMTIIVAAPNSYIKFVLPPKMVNNLVNNRGWGGHFIYEYKSITGYIKL